ncbi:hypothetical protein [Allosphingosinicella deserti]|uniref:Lipoprotein n=1 Tax=Allosphingosinicella deserti TaxID=2116704 RepID=A0A2P7QJ19_9SPHN|nr:hypothetical protein [Sphingomonas deserti]PSJ37930.1 hypothetical protein C7I55_19670 [Sphingomonas deserti]
MASRGAGGDRGLAIASALLLCGCRDGADLQVAQDQQGATFAVQPRSEGVQNCIESVSVYPAAPDDAPPLWEISGGRSSDMCVTRLRYGELPTGFGATKAAPALQPGRSYRVLVTGAGFSAATRFERAPPRQ